MNKNTHFIHKITNMMMVIKIHKHFSANKSILINIFNFYKSLENKQF